MIENNQKDLIAESIIELMRQVDALRENYAALEKSNADLRAALSPFAAMAAHYPQERHGNRPNSGPLFVVSTGALGDAEITVEHLREAARFVGDPQPNFLERLSVVMTCDVDARAEMISCLHEHRSSDRSEDFVRVVQDIVEASEEAAAIKVSDEDHQIPRI